MATYNETSRPYAFLLSEAPGTLSRERVTIVSGAGALLPGTVLGKITASSKYTPYDDGFTTGAETAAAVLAQAADSTSGDVTAQVIFRLAEVKLSELNWHASVDATAKTAAATALLTKYIAVRS